MALLLSLPWVGKSLSIVAYQSLKGAHFGEERRLHRNEENREERRLKGERHRLEGKNDHEIMGLRGSAKGWTR